MSSCTTYCEQYCDFLLFHLVIRRNMCIKFWIWNQVSLRRRIKQSEIYYVINRIFCNYLYFPFPNLTLYTILCPENFPCKIFTVYSNKHNRHSLSLTTLNTSALLTKI